jgi:hypothetical protein
MIEEERKSKGSYYCRVSAMARGCADVGIIGNFDSSAFRRWADSRDFFCVGLDELLVDVSRSQAGLLVTENISSGHIARNRSNINFLARYGTHRQYAVLENTTLANTPDAESHIGSTSASSRRPTEPSHSVHIPFSLKSTSKLSRKG